MDMIEEQAMDLINKVLSDDFPKNRIKKMRLYWEYVSGQYLPNLEVELYEEEKNAV